MNKSRSLANPPRLKGLLFSDDEIAKARKNGWLLNLSIELSNICNLRCIFCYIDAGKKKENELTVDEYKSIIDHAKELGIRTVNIIGAGEPFLDKRLFTVLDYIQKIDLYTVLFTNNTLITERIAKDLFDKPLSIVAALNSFNPEVQNRLTGGIPWAYEKMQAGLHNLLDVGFNKSNPTRIAVDLFIMKDNYNEISEIFKWARRNNVFPFVCKMLNSGRARQNDLDITDEEFKTLAYELLRIDQSEFGYTWIPAPSYCFFQCRSLYYHMVIDAEGNARPCFGIFKDLGNIRQRSLRELWNCDLMLKTRNIKNYLKGKCKSCKIFDECYGCRCKTFLNTGDLFAEDSSCWYWKSISSLEE